LVTVPASSGSIRKFEEVSIIRAGINTLVFVEVFGGACVVRVAIGTLVVKFACTILTAVITFVTLSVSSEVSARANFVTLVIKQVLITRANKAISVSVIISTISRRRFTLRAATFSGIAVVHKYHLVFECVNKVATVSLEVQSGELVVNVVVNKHVFNLRGFKREFVVNVAIGARESQRNDKSVLVTIFLNREQDKDPLDTS
jgi:hypothetical protein